MRDAATPAKLTATSARRDARRRARAMPGGFRDRLIASLKIGLPVAAALLLAALILLPLTERQEMSFVLAKDRVETSRERMRLEGAVYRGQTTDGQPFEVRAGGAVQKSSDTPVVALRSLSARVAMSDGPAVVTAPSGTYFMDRDHLDVAGPVRLTSGAGYTLNSQLVHVDLAGRRVWTERAVNGALPLGRFSANGMSADIKGHVVVLNGGAHLRITPRRGSRPA